MRVDPFILHHHHHAVGGGTATVLLLMLVTFSPLPVAGQEVKESYVTTNFIEVLWQRQDKWFGVEQFNITTTPQDGAHCVMETNCTEESCTFNTTPCGHMDPCTSTSVVVSGGNYTAPSLDTVTGGDSTNYTK
ncbi:hypothetical protein Pcinc_029000 [Petrolisthes cinctipes]|uniref:Uncharacterized protein n=1 Tax=Petrolisthes cinctipes TaxID=88211 RepID=A0AAE1F1T1_PETCI|nr:hypothetical protein Pcinc_029000 [Petrolisthes cinctipes]